jgi:hypothetical protein
MRSYNSPLLQVPKAQGRLYKEDFVAAAQDIPNTRERFPYNLHIAFLFGRGGNLLAVSTNRLGTRSRGAGFSGKTIHAERAVLKMAPGLGALRGAKLVVIRLNRHGELRNSEPCEECMCHIHKMMREHGLAKVYYSE